MLTLLTLLTLLTMLTLLTANVCMLTVVYMLTANVYMLCSWECINTGLDWTGLDWTTGLAHAYCEGGLERTLEDLPSHNAHSDHPLQVCSLIFCPCTHFQTECTYM